MFKGDLDLLLNREPCPALRLHLSNGKTFDINHRDDAVIGATTVEFLLPGEKNREAVVSLFQIVWVEVISEA